MPLGHLLASEDPARPSAVRLAHLTTALSTLETAAQARPNVARWLSLARAARSIGQRRRAVQCLQRVLDIAERQRGFAGIVIDEVFLPPDPLHDRLDPRGNRAQALQAMVDDAMLKACAFSIYYAGKKVLPLMKRMDANPLTAPEVRRRFEAARRAFG